MTFSLKGSLGLDARDFEDGAKKAEAAIGDVADKLDDVGRKDPQPRIGVDDQATDEVERLERKLQGLEGDDRTVKLNAEASRLESVIKKAERDLQGLDGMKAAPVLDMRNKAWAHLDEVKRQLEKEIPEAAETGGKSAASNLADGFSGLKGAAGAAIGGAIGTAIVTGLNKGTERIQIAAKFEQQFGLVKEDAERLGKEAADIYKGGWGESAAAVAQSLGQVQQRLVETGAIGEEVTAKIAESAIVVADTFGEDVAVVIEAVGKMMLNGLAPDAQTALDLVATAMQKGGGAAGDLFESVDEYSQHFAAFGLSAEDMMALFIHGMQNGQRDTDKLADAVKEMRIRTVDNTDAISEAYAGLGLDADAYRAKIQEGGPSAKQAFDEIIAAIMAVEDPVERNLIAIELMGTQIEDLGPRAFESFAAMSDGVDGFVGKTDEMNDALSGAQTELELLGRAGTEAFGSMAESSAGFVNNGLSGLREATIWLRGDDAWGQHQAEKAFKATEEAARDMYDAVTEGAQSSLDVEDQAIRLGVAWDATKIILARYGEEQARAAGYTSAHEQSLAELEQQAEGARLGTLDLGKELLAKERADDAAKRAASDHEKAMASEKEEAAELAATIEELSSAKADLVGGDIAVRDAVRDAQSAIEDLDAVMQDAEATTRDQEQALDDATGAQLRAAESAAEYEIAQREANGEVLSASEKNQILKGHLDFIASTLAPGSAVRANLNGYSGELGDIPDEVLTTIEANTWGAQVKLMGIAGILDGLKDKTINVTTRYVDGGRGGRAKGGPVEAGSTYWVGEEGPELVTFGQAGFVHNATESAAMAARAPAAPMMMPAGPAESSNPTGGGDTTVLVQIGERELRDIVRTEILDQRAMEMIRR